MTPAPRHRALHLLAGTWTTTVRPAALWTVEHCRHHAPVILAAAAPVAVLALTVGRCSPAGPEGPAT